MAKDKPKTKLKGPGPDPEMTALYVRLPAPEADKLDRAAFQLKAPKREIVTRLVERYVDPADPEALAALRPDRDVLIGRAAFRPAEQPEVLTLDGAAALLQVEPDDVERLATDGELPARRIGEHWRFSRAALLAWLAG
jgi:excisionase family DNA binding protein